MLASAEIATFLFETFQFSGCEKIVDKWRIPISESDSPGDEVDKWDIYLYSSHKYLAIFLKKIILIEREKHPHPQGFFPHLT